MVLRRALLYCTPYWLREIQPCIQRWYISHHLVSWIFSFHSIILIICSVAPTSQDSTIIQSLSKLLPVIPLSSTSVAHLCAYTHRGRHAHMHLDPPIFSTHSSSQSRSHSPDSESKETELDPATIIEFEVPPRPVGSPSLFLSFTAKRRSQGNVLRRRQSKGP